MQDDFKLMVFWEYSNTHHAKDSVIQVKEVRVGFLLPDTLGVVCGIPEGIDDTHKLDNLKSV